MCIRDSRQGVSPELASLLKRQLVEAMQTPVTQNKRRRAKMLERRAVERLQEGKIHAARRTMLHAIDLCENAQRLTLLACCEMLLGRLEDALEHAKRCLLYTSLHIALSTPLASFCTEEGNALTALIKNTPLR